MADVQRGTKGSGGTEFADGEDILAAEFNTDFNNIVTKINGNIDATNLAANSVASSEIDGTDAAAIRTTIDAQQDVFTTHGDVVFATTAAAASRLAVGATEEVLTSAGAAADLIWAKPRLPLGYLVGLGLSNDAVDTAHDIAIAVGECRDNANAKDFRLTTILTKQIDATWAEGDDAGGFPSGHAAIANDTWYHVFLVSKADGTVDAGFDTSLTATTLLADAVLNPLLYTGFRRIGSVLTDGSDNILAFIQNDDEVIWDVPAAGIAATNPGVAAVSRVLESPLGVRTRAKVVLSMDLTGTTNLTHMLISSLDVTDTAPALGLAQVTKNGTTDAFGAAEAEVWTDAASSVRSRLSASNASTDITIRTLGYQDRRGKE